FRKINGTLENGQLLGNIVTHAAVRLDGGHARLWGCSRVQPSMIGYGESLPTAPNSFSHGRILDCFSILRIQNAENNLDQLHNRYIASADLRTGFTEQTKKSFLGIQKEANTQ